MTGVEVVGPDVQALLARVRSGYAPPPDLRVSEFADAEIVLTSGPLAGTHWQTDFAPYQRGIMDAFHETGVQIVAVMGSSQWGKTSCCINLAAFHMAHDPCPILVVEPTVEPMAMDFAKHRLQPVIDASPRLRDVVAKKRSRDASNTILAKSFRGGSIAIGGANSAASLAARSVRLLILDEVDRYPAELPGEGSTLAIAFKRTTAYGRRRRIMLVSSPTLTGGPIDVWFHRGDQRRYHVPCPACGVMQPYKWANVRWVDRDPRTARIACEACNHLIDEAERVAILEFGQWVPESPERADPSVVSFHLWEAYSPLSTLADIVAGFLRARDAQKAGDAAEMHTWQNTTLGEPVEPDQGAGVEPSALVARREAWPEGVDVPERAAVLTMGVDVQDDRLELLVVGWGPGEESWIVDRQTLPGDTSQPDPWDSLDEVLAHEYRHGLGVRLPITATCIDSAGHRTALVYDYAFRMAARRVFAVIGRDGQRPIVSSPSPKRWGQDRRKVPLYTVGVDAAKAIWISRLGLTEAGRGFVHIPLTDWADEELAAQLTSERLVRRFEKGVPVQRWKKIRARNEALDMAVYALAALRLVHPDLDAAAARLRTEPTPAPTPRPPGWIRRRPGGWLRGR